MTPDPISTDRDDEVDAERLQAFFSAASSRPNPVPRPAAPPRGPEPRPGLDDRPPPTGPPIFDSSLAEAATIDPHAPVDMVALVRYLDAQLTLTRRHADEGIERVLTALAALDARVTELDSVRSGLFDWLESYVAWEASSLGEIAARITAAIRPPDDR